MLTIWLNVIGTIFAALLGVFVAPRRLSAYLQDGWVTPAACGL